MKRLFSCLIVMMLVAVMGTVAAAQGSEDGAEDAAGLAAIVIDAGTCGENLTWTLYDDGELVIEGEGVMYDYGGTSGLRFPWFKYEKLINTVTFGDEVSSVGRQAFCFPSFQDGLEIFPSPYMTSINLNNVSSIGELAFSYCTGLNSVSIPESVEIIYNWAFSKCSNLSEVTVYSKTVLFCDYVFDSCSSELTLYGYKGSTTETYAKENNINFVAIGERAIIASGKCGDELTWTLYDDGELVIEGEGEMYNYSLSNNSPWSNFYDSIKKVTFGDRVTSVGDNAFNTLDYPHYPNMTYVELANVSSIGEYAFCECSGLTAVDSKNVKTIKNYAFHHCNNLVTFDFTNTVTIDDFAFCCCQSLISGDLSNVTHIGASAFWCCNSMAPVKFDAIEVISAEAFVSCNLDSIDLANVKSIGDWAFQGNNLTSVTIPASVEGISSAPFLECTYLTNITVDENNKNYCSIDGVLFTKDKAAIIQYPLNNPIENYIVPDTVTYISGFSFRDNNNLVSIDLSNVEEIGNEAFRGCFDLKKVIVNNKNTVFGWTDLYSLVFDSCSDDLTLYGYKGSTTETYAKENNINFVAIGERAIIASGKCGDDLTWTLYDDGELVIEGEGAMYNYNDSSNKAPWFEYRDSLKKVTFGDGVTTVGDYAFYYGSPYYSSNITSVDLASISSIGKCAFEFCTGLASLDFANVSSIGDFVFAYCTGLTSLDFANVSSIGDYAFAFCTGLTSLDFANVSSIGNYTFHYCTGLASLDFATVSSIGGYAFHVCNALTTVVIPKSVTSIGDAPFANCNMLTGITIDAANENYCSVDGVLFDKAKTKLIQYLKGNTATSYTVPETVSSVGSDAFSSTRLTSVTIPRSVKEIYSQAFRYSILKEVTVYSKDVTYYDSSVFANHRADLTLYGYAGSTTETYAKENSIHFVALAEREIIASGKCGDNLTWTLYDDGTLVIEGTGKMYDFSNTDDNLAPWYEYRESILSLVICDGVENLGSYALLNSNVSNIDYGNTVCFVGKYAFANCNMLETVDIPNNITEILEGAFYNCDGIEFVNISEGVELIGENVFLHCDNIAAFDVDKSNKYYSSDNKGVLFTEGKQKIIRYPSGRDSDKYNIPGTVSEIGPNAFSGCSTLKDIVLPNTITRIEQSAFFECTGIEDIKLGNKISFIGEKAFSGCTGLKTVTIRGNDTILEQNSFDSSDALTLIGYKNSTTEEYADENNIKFSPVTGVKEDKKEKFDIVHDTAGSKAVPVLTGISSTDSCTEVTSCIEAPGNCTVTVVNANNQTVDADTVLCSGFKLQTKDADGNVTEEIILIVEGDTDGDGDSTLKDANAAMAEMRRLAEAESGDSAALSADQDSSPVYLIAADLDNDGVVSNVDIKNFLIMASRLTTK